MPIPTYYGDEICHVNGIPYAMNCAAEAMKYATLHRWKARSEGPARRPERTATKPQLPR